MSVLRSLTGTAGLLLGVSLCALAAAAPAAMAADPLKADTSAPVDLAADEVTHDKALNIVTARGSVEINQDGQTLYADTVSYNVRQDMVTASGNVSLISRNGDVLFADHLQLTGKMKQGAMTNLLLISADKSRTVARSGERKLGDRGQEINELDHGVYSPCDLCAGKAHPLWQVKAVQIVHDEADKDIIFRDATIDFYGVPVAYTPYLSHADPTVKRRTGLLFPRTGSSPSLGRYYQQPYYVVIDPQSDATISPMVTVKGGEMLAAEYRRTLADANFAIDGSLTDGYRSQKNTTGSSFDRSTDAAHGSLDLRGEWDISDTWRGTADLHAVSTDTYLKRYKLGSSDYQTSNIAFERFEGADYARIQALSFRELRDTTLGGLNPRAIPRTEWTHVGETGSYGGYWTTSVGSAFLSRNDGADSNRLSASGFWTLPYVAPDGEHYTLTAGLKGDAYQVSNYETDDGRTFAGTAGRVIPETSLKWSMPFVSPGRRTIQTIEPMVVGTLSPYGGNPRGIPNEDSRDLQFDDTQVMATNHFVGHDRVETGPRAAYGVDWSVLVPGASSRFSTFLGEAVRAREDSVFSNISGIREGLSDYVGRVGYLYSGTPATYSATYRFRINQKTNEFVSNDVVLNYGTRPFSLGISYLNIRDSLTKDLTAVEDVEQLGVGVTSQFTQEWQGSFSISHDLTESTGGPLGLNGVLTYEDECFAFRTTVRKDYTSDRDDSGGWSFLFTFIFKTMGQIGLNG